MAQFRTLTKLIVFEVEFDTQEQLDDFYEQMWPGLRIEELFHVRKGNKHFYGFTEGHDAEMAGIILAGLDIEEVRQESSS